MHQSSQDFIQQTMTSHILTLWIFLANLVKTRWWSSLFYAFTGCDSTSSIFNKGKCKCWDVWLGDKRSSGTTSVFISLSNAPVLDCHFEVLEYFVKRLYSTNELSASLTEERLSNFERSGDNDLRKIPMSRPGLVEHTKRSCYQAGYLWRECIGNVTLPDPVY